MASGADATTTAAAATVAALVMSRDDIIAMGIIAVAITAAVVVADRIRDFQQPHTGEQIRGCGSILIATTCAITCEKRASKCKLVLVVPGFAYQLVCVCLYSHRNEAKIGIGSTTTIVTITTIIPTNGVGKIPVRAAATAAAVITNIVCRAVAVIVVVTVAAATTATTAV
jgi:hypothetical protein